MGEYGEFKDIIKKLRESAGLTQDEEAKKIHISRSNIAMYETGMRKPSKKTLEAFADFFNVDVDYLLGRTLKITRLPESNGYYLNSETAKVAQEIFEKDKVLFDVYKSSDKDRLVAYANRLKALRDMEEGNI